VAQHNREDRSAAQGWCKLNVGVKPSISISSWFSVCSRSSFALPSAAQEAFADFQLLVEDDMQHVSIKVYHMVPPLQRL
jgi:hypothetical protein